MQFTSLFLKSVKLRGEINVGSNFGNRIVFFKFGGNMGSSLGVLLGATLRLTIPNYIKINLHPI